MQIKTAPADLSKLSNIVHNDIFKKTSNFKYPVLVI